jgi:predicted GNAT family acetyltransferase
VSSARGTLAKEYATEGIVVERGAAPRRRHVEDERGPRGTDELQRAPAGSPAEAEVVDVPQASRYELRLDGHLIGLAAYRRREGRIAFTHTEVDESCEGRGFGSRLAAAALDDAARNGLEVVPLCPFIAGYIERHREYEQLVAQ